MIGCQKELIWWTMEPPGLEHNVRPRLVSFDLFHLANGQPSLGRTDDRTKLNNLDIIGIECGVL